MAEFFFYKCLSILTQVYIAIEYFFYVIDLGTNLFLGYRVHFADF